MHSTEACLSANLFYTTGDESGYEAWPASQATV